MSDFDAWYVWNGVGTLSVDGITHDARRGRLFVLKPGQQLVGRHEPLRPLGVTYVHFDVRARPDARTFAHRFPTPTDVADADGHERMLRRVVALFAADNAGRTAAERLLESVLLALPYDAVSNARADDAAARRVREVARFVREHPGEILSIEALAERAAYAPDHFAVVFKRVIGVPPKEYCIRARIDRAAQLLRSSALGVGEIAAALGYGDVYFFSRQFKARTGLSPLRWRDQAREPALPAVSKKR